MIDILQTLIAFPSVTGEYTANNQGLEYIDTFLSERGMHVERFEFNGFESLVATTQRTKTPAVMLQAHLDVAPAPERLFTLRDDHEKLYGRGVFDMKFAITAYLQMVDDIKDRLHDYDFGIMITCDEEIGGFDGVYKLVEAGYVPKKVCILPDGGDNWAIETFAKGIWFGQITMPGTSAHGSRPWEGESALEKLIALLEELKKLVPNQGRETNTMTIGTLHAGKIVNQIPDEAIAEVDFRTMTLAEHTRLKAAAAKLCAEHGATIAFSAEGIPCINDITNPYIKRFADIIEQVIGHPGGTTMSFAGSDARHFSAVGVPCVIVRPDGGSHHGDGEWLSREGLFQLRTILCQYIDDMARTTKQPVAAGQSIDQLATSRV